MFFFMQKIFLVEPASGFSSVLGMGVEAKMLSQNNKPNGGKKMKKFYEVYVTVDSNEFPYIEDYKLNVKATCVKDAIEGALMHLYDTEEIDGKEVLSIKANKMPYIEVEEED